MDYLISFLIFLAYGLTHSIFASRRVKQWIISLYSPIAAYYRIIYSFFALLLLYPWWLSLPDSSRIFWNIPMPYRLINATIIIWAAFQFLLVSRQFGGGNFLGWNQVLDYWKSGSLPMNEDETHAKSLIISGWYKHIRHPLYFLSMVVLLANPVMSDRWLFITICCLFYFVVGSRNEERRLISIFGDEYLKYKKQVPALFPIKLFSRS